MKTKKLMNPTHEKLDILSNASLSKVVGGAASLPPKSQDPPGTGGGTSS